MVNKIERWQGTILERERIINLIWECYNADKSDCDHVFVFIREVLERIG